MKNVFSMHERRSHWRIRQRGYTIVEVVIAVVITSVALMAGLRLSATVYDSVRSNRQARVAVELAETALERVKRESVSWGGSNQFQGASIWLGPVLATPDTWVLAPAYSGSGFGATVNDLGIPNETGLTTLPTAEAERAEFVERNSAYCIQLRGSLLTNTMARVEARVIWPRGDEGAVLLENNCSRIGSTISEAQLDFFFNRLQLTSGIRAYRGGIDG